MNIKTLCSMAIALLLMNTRDISAAEGAAAAANQGAPAEELQEVVVTGSRISRPDFVSDHPIVTVTAEELQASAKINVETALEQNPQFQNGQDENYNPNGANGGRAVLNLRGLGKQRTLVLLDGRRLSPTDATGVANLNQVPGGIVQSVQTITGGASAAYGTDAMAGVVNIISKNVDGMEFGLSHGAANGGIGRHEDAYLNAGTAFAGERGHVMVAIQYTKRDEVTGAQIPFFFFGGQGANIPYGSFVPTTTPTGTAANLPSQAAVDAYFAKYGSPPAGVANTVGLGFNNDGTLYDIRTPFYNYQGPLGGRTGILNVGGSLVLAIGQHADVTPPQTRYTLYSKASYDLTDNTHLYMQGLLTYNKVSTFQAYQQIMVNAAITIPVTNPFVPADLKPLLASRPRPTENFAFAKRLLDFPPQLWDEYFDTDQVLVGANGRIPGTNLNWDVYYMHDYSIDAEVDDGVTSLFRVQQLLSAPDGGNSICAGGFNPFQGYHSYVSPQCLAYLETTTHTTTTENQDAIEANLTGKLFDSRAGEGRFALTGDWRQWHSSYSPDNLLIVGNPPSASGGGANPTSGTISLGEAGGEVFLPVLKDKPFAKALNANVAYRYSKYNISGTTSTYKFSTDWRPTQALMFRGGYEHAIRAPNINDLFQFPTTTSVQIGNTPIAGDPCDSRSALRNGPNGAQIAALCVAQGIPQAQIATYQYITNSASSVGSGSLLVKPEIGDTITVGAVLTPNFSRPALAGLQLSLDYYHIKITDAISTSGYQYVLNNCYNVSGANPTYSAANPSCQLIDRNFGGTPGGVLRILQPVQNLGGLQASGVDAELDWNWRLADLGWGERAGQLRWSSMVTWSKNYSVQQVPNAPWFNYAGTIPLPLSPTPPVPVWRALTTLSYQFQPVPVTLGLRWRYIDGMRDISTVLNPASTISGVPVFNYLDITGSWKISNRFSLSATVTNVTNNVPPRISDTDGFTQVTFYDITSKVYLLSLHGKL